MLTVLRNNNEVIIRGDFWEFDRLYFAIAKFTGNYGINGTCPFPGYETVCESLLGLNYELRKAQEGKRELYEQYNGIPTYWFDEEILEENMDESDDFYDEFDDLDDDIDECIEQDHSSVKFSKEDYPNTTEKNTLLQTRISLSEALYYALIFRELLEKKERFISQRKELAMDNSCGLQEFNAEYYYCGAHSDLALITIYMESIFQVLYHLIGKDAYIRYMSMFNTKPNGFLNCNLNYCNTLVVDYGIDPSAAPVKNITEYLNCLYREL